MPDTGAQSPQLASQFGPAQPFTQPPPLTGLAYDAAVLADAPVLYITDTAADVSGNGHTVSAAGSPTAAAVLPNGDPGWSFDASGTQYLQVADADDLSVVTSGQLTVECWAAPSAVNQPNAKNTQYVNFISKAGFQPGAGSNQNEWELRYFSSNTTDPGNPGEAFCGYAFTSLGAASATGNDDTLGVSPGQWAHLVVVYTATTVTIYRDGRQVNTATFSGVPQNGTAPVTIGAGQVSESDASFWYGSIGKVAVYRTALSPARITAHYMAMGLQVSAPVLVNTSEGGSGGTTVTNTNSGGLSGHPWDSVTIGAGAAAVFDKTHTVHGRFSVSLTLPSGTASSTFLQWSSSAIGTQRTAWFRFYLYLTAYPTVNVRVFTGVQTASLCGALLLTTTGHLLATDSLGGTNFTFAGAVPLNRHVRIEGFLTGDAAAGQWEVRQFNTADSLTADEIQTSAANLSTTGPLNIYRFGFASTTTQTSALSSWWDDIGLSAAGYLGPSPAGQFQAPVPYPVPNAPWISPLASRFGPNRPFQAPALQPQPAAAQAAAATAAGAGSVNASGVITGSANLNAAAAVTSITAGTYGAGIYGAGPYTGPLAIPVPYAQPGRTWRRRFGHPQQQQAGPAAVPAAGTASLAAAGAVTAAATIIVPATTAGAGSLTAVAAEPGAAAIATAAAIAATVTQAVTASPAGAGSTASAVTEAVTSAVTAAGAVTANVTQDAGTATSLAGSGAVSASALVTAPPVPAYAAPGPTWLRRFRHRQAVAPPAPAAAQAGDGTALAGAAAVAAAVTQDAGTSTALAGAGSVTAVATVTAPAALAGAGSITAVIAEPGTATLAGAGQVTAGATQAVTSAPAGAGSVADVATQAVTAAPQGTGAITAAASSSGAAGAAIAAASTVAARTAQVAAAAPQGAGQVTASAAQAAAATAAGAGSVNASGVITGSANLAAAGAVTAGTAQAAPVTAAAAGTLAALAAQQANTALAAAGALNAAGSIQVAFTVGALTAADAPGGVLTAASGPVT